MTETKYSPEWTQIYEDVINANQEQFKEIIELGLAIGVVVSKEAPKVRGREKYGECIPIKKDHLRQFCRYDYLIKIYEPNAMHMDDEQRHILMEHELMHISAHEDEAGELVISTSGHDVEDFREIIAKYGWNWARDKHEQMTWDDYEDEEYEATEVTPTTSKSRPMLPEGQRLIGAPQ